VLDIGANEIVPSVSSTQTLSDHSYAITDSPHKLKRQCDVLEEQLRETKRSLYNAERRETRAKATLAKVLTDLEKENLIAAEAQRLLKNCEGLPVHLFSKANAAYSEEQ